MAYETLIVAYDRSDRATEAVRAIRRLGVPSADIKRHPVDAGSIADIAAAPDEAAGSGIWGWLFGRDEAEERLGLYKTILDRGGTVISLRVMEDEADRMRTELDRHGLLDVAAAGKP